MCVPPLQKVRPVTFLCRVWWALYRFGFRSFLSIFSVISIRLGNTALLGLNRARWVANIYATIRILVGGAGGRVRSLVCVVLENASGKACPSDYWNGVCRRHQHPIRPLSIIGISWQWRWQRTIQLSRGSFDEVFIALN